MFWLGLFVIVLLIFCGLAWLGVLAQRWDAEFDRKKKLIKIKRSRAEDALLRSSEMETIKAAIAKRDWATVGKTLSILEDGRFETGEFYQPLYLMLYGETVKKVMRSFSDAEGDILDIEEAILFSQELDAYVAKSDDHILASVAATIKQRIGYFYRGEGWIDSVSETDLEKFTNAYEEADNALEKYDGLNSPIVQFARLAMYPAIGDGPAWLDKRFQKLLDADPRDFGVYTTQVSFLLPKWGGSWKAIELLARKLYAQTQAEYGAAFYAYVIIMAAFEDQEMSEYWDDALMSQGLKDLAATKHARLVNRAAGFIYDMNEKTHKTCHGNKVRIDRPEWKGIFSHIIRHDLLTVQTDVWADDPDYVDMWEVKEAILKDFEYEFSQGVTLLDFTGETLRMFKGDQEVPIQDGMH